MIRLSVSLTVVAALAACDGGEPAGGRGYFDPPPPAPIYTQPQTVPIPQGPAGRPDTVIASPSGVQEVDPNSAAASTQPRSALNDPNQQLAQDVTAALSATPTPAGTAAADPQAALGGDIGIDPNDDSINLAEQSQEQQKRQREVAAQRRAAAQQQLVIVQPEAVPQQDINANVVQFARETTHPVGTKVYNRPAFRSRTQSASVCRRFDSVEEAQRQFLANGGPNTDRFNLDPDGDGFACKFDPETYRKLKF